METKNTDMLLPSDFEKAVEALRKANVPGPVVAIVNTDEWTEEQWKLYEMMEEMAGAPKEEYGKRRSGEKGGLERVAARRFGVGEGFSEKI